MHDVPARPIHAVAGFTVPAASAQILKEERVRDHFDGTGGVSKKRTNGQDYPS
jgi:hypothetical protein